MEFITFQIWLQTFKMFKILQNYLGTLYRRPKIQIPCTRYTVQTTKDTDTMHYVHYTDNQRYRYNALCTLYRQPNIQISCTMYTVQITKDTDTMHYVHYIDNQRYHTLCTLYRQPKIQIQKKNLLKALFYSVNVCSF